MRPSLRKAKSLKLKARLECDEPVRLCGTTDFSSWINSRRDYAVRYPAAAQSSPDGYRLTVARADGSSLALELKSDDSGALWLTPPV